MTLCRLFEGIDRNEMQDLVSNVIEIDRHKPKTSTDENVVVVAFTTDYENVANDLANFIETGATEHLDVDVSFAPNRNSKYQVYIEFERDKELFNKVSDLLYDVEQASGIDQWKFIAYKSKEEFKFDYDAFNEKIAATPEQYKKVSKIHERMNFLINY